MSTADRFVAKSSGHEAGRPVAFALDRAGHIRSWSSSALAMFGDANGRGFGAFLPEAADRRVLEEALAEAARGRPFRGVVSARRADGGVQDIELSLDPDLRQDLVLATVLDPGAALRDNDLVRLALAREASTRIGTTLDLGQTARELTNVAVPRFADGASVLVHDRLVREGEFPDAADRSAVVRRLSAAITGDRIDAWAKAFPIDEVGEYGPDTPNAQCLSTGRPIVVRSIETSLAREIALAWRQPLIADLLDHNSMLIMPLKARGRMLGFAVFTRLPEQPPFDDDDVSLAEELTARAAVCLDNARLYHRERRTALTLQSSLLPARLSVPLGLDIAHRYLPASDMIEVGGDWYDVIPLPGCRVALVVGDVMGHGTRGAAMMGQLRTAVRTLAVLDLPPEKVLTHLDQMTQDLDTDQFATCVYAIYDPVTRQLNLSRAGHVPPMLIHPDGEGEIIDIPAGLPLGIGGEPYQARELTLPDESTLVLCTDGLVESREKDIEWGLTRLQEYLARPRRDLDALCAATVAALRPHHGERDDIALLLARVQALSAEQHAWWALRAEAYSVRLARTYVRDTLADWGLGGIAEIAGLLATEIVTNAIIHGSGPLELRLLRGDGVLVCEVIDGSADLPLLRTPDRLAPQGRGLQLVSSLAARWGARLAGTGKAVWYELPLT